MGGYAVTIYSADFTKNLDRFNIWSSDYDTAIYESIWRYSRKYAYTPATVSCIAEHEGHTYMARNIST